MKLYIGRIDEIEFDGDPQRNTYAYVLKGMDLQKKSKGQTGFLSEGNMQTGFGLTLNEMEQVLCHQLDVALRNVFGDEYDPKHFSFTYKYEVSGEGGEDGLFWPNLWRCGNRVEVGQ